MTDSSPACAEHLPCDECRTCAAGRCCRRDNPAYRLPALGSITPIHGDLGVRNDDGARVECHVCGGWFLSVASHSWAAHDVTMAEYRAAFGLSSRGMIGPEYRSRLIHIQRAAAAKRPPMVAPPATAEQRRAGRESMESARVIAEAYKVTVPKLLAASHTPEALAKMRQTKMGQRLPMERRVCVVCGGSFSARRYVSRVTCSPTCHRSRCSEAASVSAARRIAEGTFVRSPTGPHFPPEMTAEVRAKLSVKAKERSSTPEAKAVASARLRGYFDRIGPDAANAQRRSANRIATSLTRRPHYCTAGCGTLLPKATPKTCSPECRRLVRQRTARGEKRTG